ncbi:MAG: hypothetical protein JW860_05720, partial [Sedimentisphaerales bacterium]|nr:hypothetical protein [Sedimentisphaerales bacterium]
MLRKLRRQYERVAAHMLRSGKEETSGRLRLEPLEQRLLLATEGWWDELGWRSATGGGVTWDNAMDAADAELVLSVDGDPMILWIEGDQDLIDEYVGGNDGSGRLPFHWEITGNIYARQYAGEDLGWWEIAPGSSEVIIDDDTGQQIIMIGTGSEMEAASGPNGEVAVVWVTQNIDDPGLDNNINVNIWDGDSWLAAPLVVSNGEYSEKPSIEYSANGEIFVSYTAIHPDTSQRDIVVKKYGYILAEGQEGPPGVDNLGWIELVNEDVGLFGEQENQMTGGMSNDQWNSYDSAITVDLQGRPIVAWVNQPWEGGTEIYVKRWNGNSWVELGTGSASDADGKGNSGISNDPQMSLQPDIAVAPNGDVIVTWVGWQNWDEYDDNGQAGVFVKVLRTNSSVWEPYAGGSASGAGIAQDSSLGSGYAGLGWYYMPRIDVDSSSNPFIVWQGVGEGERYTAQRIYHNVDEDWPEDLESPLMGIYASHYESGQFDLLSTNVRGVANLPSYITWLPEALVGPNDELILAYTWRDKTFDPTHVDAEIFVQTWNGTWTEYGRGSNSNGNDIIGSFSSSVNVVDVQAGLIDYDNDPATEPDVMVVVGEYVYRYDRQTDSWKTDVDLQGANVGLVYDLRGEPEYEYQIDGPPLLAFLDDTFGVPYVYEWVGGSWNLVGGGAAGTSGTLVVGGISVQAGPEGKILLAYNKDISGAYRIVTRLWDPTVGVWQDAGDNSGYLPITGGTRAVYYSDFYGYDWDEFGDLQDGAYNDVTNERIYDTMNQWRGWDITDYNALFATILINDPEFDIPDLVEWSTDGGWLWIDEDGNENVSGMQVAFTIPEIRPEGDEGANLGAVDIDEDLVAELDYNFQMMADDYVIVELAYSLDARQVSNADLHIYMDIKDTAGTTLGSYLIDTLPAGTAEPADPETNGQYNESTTLMIDTRELTARGISPLSQGENILSFRAVADISDEGADWKFDEDDQGWVYEGIVTPGIGAGAWDAKADELDEWYVNGVASEAGLDDLNPNSGGLTMVLTDPGAVNMRAQYEKDFRLAGNATVELAYQLIMDGNFDTDSQLFLMIAIDGQYITSNNEEGEMEFLGITKADAAGDPEDSGYTTVSIDLGGDNEIAALSALTEGSHTLTIEAWELGNLTGGAVCRVFLDNISVVSEEPIAYARFDNVSVYQRTVPESTPSSSSSYTFEGGLQGWLGAADNDPGGEVTIGHAPGEGFEDDGIKMTLGDGVDNDSTDISAIFTSPAINVAQDSYLQVNFDYSLTMGSAISTHDSLEMTVSVDGTDQLMTFELVAGTGTSESGEWRTMLQTGQYRSGFFLAPGAYNLEIRGELSQDGEDGGGANGQASIIIDNVTLELHDGFGDWEFLPDDAKDGAINGDTGSNETVGPNDMFNFQGDIHCSLSATGGTQSFIIENVNQGMKGDMWVMFRYRVYEQDGAELTNGDINVYIDDVAYDSEDPEDHAFPLSWATNAGWYNNDDFDPLYTWVLILAEDIEAGDHEIKIELTSTGVDADCWIDNLVVLAAELTDGVRPIATLLPSGIGGSREFGVGVVNTASNLWVYATADQEGDGDVYPDGQIIVPADYYDDPLYLFDGYLSGSIFQLQNDTTWDKYGVDISSTVPVDFMGVGSSELASEYEMPSAEDNILADMAIGKDQLEWAAVYTAASDFVDVDDDGVGDWFEVHWWEPVVAPIYWTVARTDLTSSVLRWEPFPDDPRNALGWEPNWADTGFVPVNPGEGFFDEFAVTNLQLVSSGDQQPVVAWTVRGLTPGQGGMYGQAGALRYEAGGVWDILGPSENIQNTRSWGSSWIFDMISVPDGDPIITEYLGHLSSFGITEFRSTAELPEMEIIEDSGVVNDDKLEFGQTTNTFVDEGLRIINNGPGDLIIYDISFGGYGDLASSPFSLVNPPAFPIELDQAGGNMDSIDFVVRFNPAGVAAGVYDSILLVQSSYDSQNSKHPFSHFQEINLKAEVLSQSNQVIDANDLWLRFDNTILFPVYDPDDLSTRNGGGVSNLEAQFQKSFYVSAAGDVDVSFDYRLLLGDTTYNVNRLVDDQTLTLYVSVDGDDVAEIGQLTGTATTRDSGYLSTSLTLEDLAAGSHVISWRGELSESLGGVGGAGTIRLDNIVIGADINENFQVKPGVGVWSFVDDTEDPAATSGAWRATAGKTGGGLQMVLGYPLEIEDIIIRNQGQTDLTIFEWYFEGINFRLLEESRDDIAGVVWYVFNESTNTYTASAVSSENISGSSDDVVLGAGDYLEMRVVFEPYEIINYDEFFTIRTDSSTNNIIDVRLTGDGISGASILVTDEDGIVIPIDDGRIDLGSVIRGTTSDSYPVTITNQGSTDLTISTITEMAQPRQIQFTPPVITDVTIEAGDSYTFYITYTPQAVEDAEDLDVLELNTLIRIISDDPDADDRLYNIEVVGLGVPEIPLVGLFDPDTGQQYGKGTD